MKKQFFLFLILTVFICSNSYSATPAFDANGVKSSRQKERREKAKCNEITDNDAKELCLEQLEEKAAKKRQKESDDSNQQK